MDHSISEIQIESGGRRINAYKPQSKEGLDLLNNVIHLYPLDINYIASVGYHIADNINYLRNSYAIIMKGHPPQYLRDELNVSVPAEYFAYIIWEDGTLNKKLYDKNIDDYALPALPKGCRIQRYSGIGVNSSHSVQDIYFMHNDRDYVLDFFKDIVGNDPFLDQEFTKEGFFGVSFDSKSLEPKMLKRYIFND